MKLVLILMFALLTGCHAVSQEGSENGVSWKGSLKTVHHGDTSAQLTLEKFEGSENIYAVGPVADLAGEITAFGGKFYVSKVEKGRVQTTSEMKTGAAFLVWSEVAKWKQVPQRKFTAKSHSELGYEISKEAEKQGIDLTKPFPFLIEGTFESVEYHVLQPMTEEQKKNFEPGPGAHKEAALNLKAKGKPGKIIGFYSRNHGGVFTHMGSNLHMHILMDDGTSGHVDEIAVQGDLKVSFPAR